MSRVVQIKVSVTSLGRPIRPALISGFRSMKRIGVFILLPGWDASPSQGEAMRPPRLPQGSKKGTLIQERKFSNYFYFKVK